MKLIPEASLDFPTQISIAVAYGLGEPVDANFVARGAMGAVNLMRTVLAGERRSWTVKRAYWNQFTEQAIAREVDFTRQCAVAGVPAPRSIERVDNGGYVLSVDDQDTGESQFRVLEWVEGEVGRNDDPETIPPLADWMARIHKLAVDPAGHPIDPWYVRATYDWDDLADRLEQRAPDVATEVRARRTEFQELTDLVNATQAQGAVWCHNDIAASNLIWSPGGPQLIDWEDAGPLVPHQQLSCWLRSIGPLAKAAYHAYRQDGGPAEITDVSHIASSVAVHLNYIGSQAELLLNDEHIEQHDFARKQVTGAVQGPINLRLLDQWVKDLNA
jgi:hypothetical protein